MESGSSGNNLKEVKVHIVNTRRHTHGPAGFDVDKSREPKMSSRSNDFVYVNSAYVGSTNSVNQTRIGPTVVPPTTTVYREQYWACSKWPYGQRVLAIAVGLLLGTIVGLAVTLSLTNKGENGPNIFRTYTSPD